MPAATEETDASSDVARGTGGMVQRAGLRTLRRSWCDTGPMSCEEKRRLATEYEATTPKFSEAVTELRKKMGTSAKEEYQRLDRAANEAARNLSKRALRLSNTYQRTGAKPLV